MSRDVPPPASFGAMRTVIARAPTRIDLGGGWTDVPPYSLREGGRVCNVAITRHAEVRVTSGPTAEGDVRSAADTPLAFAAARRLGITGIRTSLRSDFPTGAGLGGSSAVGVAMIAALRHWSGQPATDRAALAEESRSIEVEDVKVPGGRQDHYAAAFGGALDLSFGEATTVRSLALAAPTQGAFEHQCIVAYTGQSRISGDTITAVLDAWERGEPHVLQSLERMKALAGEMALTLERGDLDALGELLDEHWRYQRALHPAIPTERIDVLLAAARAAGARGGKALGASGGGCVAVLAPATKVDEVRAAMGALAQCIDFAVDTRGVTVSEEEQA